ncbi:hypothetical protein ACJJIR_11595 [Microbulbifer sp. SSSA008]|uniref:hypothetical protein n=1 Tax=Microbulbifer sp. SSSA008 TaxID=3243380 RepID=UPI004039D003
MDNYQRCEIGIRIVIAKDMFPDTEGNTHYSIEAEIDMLVSEYFEKLAALKKYMRVK